MKKERLAGCFVSAAILICLLLLTGADYSHVPATPDPTATPTPELFVITLAPTPEPTPDPQAPTAPPVIEHPALVLSKFQNDPQSIDVAAKSAYYSPFDQLYWKFVLWSVEYNRSISPAKVKGFYRYARTFVGVTADRNEFPFWSSETPRSRKGQELLRLNVIAADLFFDYIQSTAACGSDPIVPYSGVILEFVQNKDGLNRSANVYDLDGRFLTLMSETDFNETIGREYARRLNGTN